MVVLEIASPSNLGGLSCCLLRASPCVNVPVIHLHSVRQTLAFTLHRLGVTPGDAAALFGGYRQERVDGIPI